MNRSLQNRSSELFVIAVLLLISSGCSINHSRPLPTPPPSLTPHPTQATPTPIPIDTSTPTPIPTITVTPAPSFTPSPTSFLTPVHNSPGFFDQLESGEYIVMGDGVFSLGEKTFTPMDHYDIPMGRLSPDGKKSVTIRVDPSSLLDHSYHYQVIDLVTGDEIDIPVPDNCEATFPDWSADGKMLMTSCVWDNQIIVQSYPDGKEKSRVLLDDPENKDFYDIDYPMWSYDGKWVAYIQFNHDMGPNARGDEVFVFNSDCLYDPSISCKDTKKRAARIIGSGWNLIDWASKDRLVVLEQEKQRFLVYDVNIVKLVRVISLFSRFAIPGFAVSPDGNYIYFSQMKSDQSGSTVYRASLNTGAIEKIYFEEGNPEIWVYSVIKKE